MPRAMKATYVFPHRYETALGKYLMALQAYLPTLHGSWYKVSAQQIFGFVRVLSFILLEKKKEGSKNTDAQAPYDKLII